jgi:hypothetical protein
MGTVALMSLLRTAVFSLATVAALSGQARAAEPDGCLHPTWCPAPSSDPSRDLLDTALALDVTALTGRATITFVPSMASTGASFDVHGLIVRDVRGPLGPLQYQVVDGRLDVGVPLGTVELTIDYDFTLQDDLNGLSSSGSTYLWPYHCGNLFPCKSETSEGQSFALTVTGVPEGQIAVYPSIIPANAPSYMPALAIGAYSQIELGTTPSGTRLSVWVLPGGEDDALAGTERLVDAFAFFEQTLGVYTYGSHAGVIEANDAGSGMEHHPFWHLSRWSMSDPLAQFHEAAHGWFGNGVRMRCWEDFALSEGNANYWSARAVEAIYGAPAADEIWAYYQSVYDFYVRFGIDRVLSPDTCNAIDINRVILRNLAYDKGALFLRALEQRVGRVAFDRAMSVFYMWHVGQTSTMDELAETVQWVTGVDVSDLQQLWLHETVKGGSIPGFPGLGD